MIPFFGCCRLPVHRDLPVSSSVSPISRPSRDGSPCECLSRSLAAILEIPPGRRFRTYAIAEPGGQPRSGIGVLPAHFTAMASISQAAPLGRALAATQERLRHMGIRRPLCAEQPGCFASRAAPRLGGIEIVMRRQGRIYIQQIQPASAERLEPPCHTACARSRFASSVR